MVNRQRWVRYAEKCKYSQSYPVLAGAAEGKLQRLVVFSGFLARSKPLKRLVIRRVPVKLDEFQPDIQKVGHGLVVNQSRWERVLEGNKKKD